MDPSWVTKNQLEAEKTPARMEPKIKNSRDLLEVDFAARIFDGEKKGDPKTINTFLLQGVPCRSDINQVYVTPIHGLIDRYGNWGLFHPEISGVIFFGAYFFALIFGTALYN